jgi:uncharacterized damage-inducible protein DinB
VIDREHARLMARYNRWMNQRLYEAAACLSEAQRREDRGAFFKSIQGTLNHIVWGDRIWLNRFTGQPIEGLNPKAGLDDPFETLRARRAALDEELLSWVEGLSSEWLAADFRYFSVALQGWFTRPAWTLVTHLFNHQTHHRGQVTTLLMQFGIDPGVTDLPVEPELSAAYGAATSEGEPR